MKVSICLCVVLIIFPFLVSAQCDGSPGQCLGTQSFTVNPLPSNGHYPAGTVVFFCYSLTNYNQCNSNWLHTIDIDLGPGWDSLTLTPLSLPASCDSQGVWGLYPPDTGTFSGIVYGPCFSYDSPLGYIGAVIDSIPGNNFRDNCTEHIWTFCFSVTVKKGCQGESLSVAVTAVGDGSAGSWPESTCPGVPFYLLDSIYCSSCSESVSILYNQPVCSEDSVTALAIVNGGLPPYTYLWIPTGDSTQSISNITSGVYSVTITDSVGCTATATIAVEIPDGLVVNAGTDTIICLGSDYIIGGSPSATGGVPPYHYLWSEFPLSDSANLIITPNVPAIYHLAVTDSNNCVKTDSVFVDVTICTGIEAQNDDHLIDIFPNPNNGNFTIRGGFSKEYCGSLVLYNALGKEVFRKENISAEERFELNWLENGIYFISVQSNEFIVIKELIKSANY